MSILKNLKITLVSEISCIETKKKTVNQSKDSKLVCKFYFIDTDEPIFTTPKRVNANTLELVVSQKTSESIDEMENNLFLLKRASQLNMRTQSQAL